ncbi:MAG TPA: LysE family transporter [Candidatus Sulfotelmatobacter sp.]|nr:LysE family transporter [Candidatus Sulfotelmatobacter sp.]
MDSVFGIALTSFLIGLSGAMMPGPVLTVTIGETAARVRRGDARTAGPWAIRRAQVRGALAGPLIVLGHAILEILLVVAIVLGLGKILTLGPVIGTVGLVGGLVLLWMGWGMVAGLSDLRLETADDGRQRTHPILAGFLTSLSNPYWALWWATVGLSYIALSMRLGLAGLTFFYVGHILSDLAWYSSISVTLALGRRLLTDRIYRGLVTACAAFLLGFGLYFGYAGLRQLLA